MLSSEAFDRWAGSYDADVRDCARRDDYPFAGYFDALETLFSLVRTREGAEVLDLGFGTAVLTQQLYTQGHPVSGVDFSAEMLALAREKMPDAQLFRYDLTEGLPPELSARQFDFILASYSLHHLTDSQKVDFLSMLRRNLTQDGVILIADVSFESRASLNLCREACGGEWDDEECYFVLDELREALPEYDIDAIPMSFCADVLILTPAE
ncbi:MAG: class I SAM-dependent methyltransferase [Clostridiaceae bacterium]|nr:class I SAM-dependent methyltransferase [Clostridiaceae bacterium]